MPEGLLTGGHLNPVVRVGETVRRTAGPWTPAVHLLLEHLERSGFDGAPRVLGFDERGREVLSLLDGDRVAGDELPEWVWTDEALAEAGRVIRRYHDACRSFKPPPGAHWQVMVGAPATGEVICHNDLSPYNAIYRDGLPRAFVDWDLASPGPPMWDVADAAWRFIPVSPDVERSRRATAATKATRLTMLCDAYGLDERGELLQTIHRRIRCSYDTLRKWGQAGVPGWAEMWRAGDHGESMLRCLVYLDEHWRTFARELS